jgi:Tfp pilus assembly protein PilO
MIPFLDRLNLRPQERRFVVVVGLILFVVVNLVWVRPRFKDWHRLQNELMDARRTLGRYKTEADKLPSYRATLARLEGETPVVLPAEQAIQLYTTVQEQARQHGVGYNQIRPSTLSAGSRTNAFFEEQSVIINVNNTGERELVDFLSSLVAGNSMIRVRDMDIKPDPSQTRLMGSITLVATYQKKPPAPAKTPVAAKSPSPPSEASAPPKTTTPSGVKPAEVKPAVTPPTNRPPYSVTRPSPASSPRNLPAPPPPQARVTNTVAK